MFPKKGTAKKRTPKRWTSQQIRKNYINAICDLWSIMVKNRDGGMCQFSGKTDCVLNAHHIVSKGTLKGKVAGYFDIDNGISLSYYEHNQAHRGEPDSYIEKRDQWLKSNGLNYKSMKEKYLTRTKFSADDLKLIYSDFRYKVQKLKRHCEQLTKIHKRWIYPMEKAGVL